jgi:hypothetical protein
LSRYSVRVNDETKLLEIDKSKKPMHYDEAAALAAQQARSDSESFRQRQTFQAKGTEVGEAEAGKTVYDLNDERNKP